MLGTRAWRSRFAKECRNDKPELGAYCDCAWTTKRKTQSVGELANGAGITARKELMKECAGKISEATVKKAFMSVCREGGNNDTEECACIWKQARAIAPPVELTLGTIDKAKLKARLEKHCPTAAL